MIIDEKVKNKLLTWDNDGSIYKQFEKKCATLSKISNLIINPEEYQAQYDSHVASMDTYVNLQTELYTSLYEKYPELEFGMMGRLKSPFSHYEKIIRKFVELFEKDELKVVEIMDDYAIKIFPMSINYPVTKASVDTEGIYIDSRADEFRINDSDVFCFSHNGRLITVPVQEGQANIWISNSVPYISTTYNDEVLPFPLNEAITYKKSTKESLVEYCNMIRKDVQQFYNSKGFATKKRKNYIDTPKPSGYSSIQDSFYSEELDLGIECQTRTYDMERFNNKEREYGYKPSEHKASANSLNKISRFALTTCFQDGIHTYRMTDAECFEYLYGISLTDYRKQMKPTLKPKEQPQKENEGTSR